VAAVLATLAVLQLAGRVGSPSGPTPPPAIVRGQPVPGITGTTLDGASFDLASLRGRPVVVNFWGPSCEPCRDEFPLLLDKLREHAGDGLGVVGVLMYDTAPGARDFVSQYGATWPTVDDPSGAIRDAYRVAARPQSYFVDRDGILRSIQVGELTDCEFERQYALIAGAPGASPPASTSPCGIGGTPNSTLEIPPPP
jgi:cytochrome c biogenesis protein CcmG, thiol:disulfide interchange protein DsbE